MAVTRSRSRVGVAAGGSGAHGSMTSEGPPPSLAEESSPDFQDAEALAFVLDRLPVGIVLVDGSGRVVWMNCDARARLEAGDGLALRRGRLAARLHSETDAIQHLIERAIAATPSGKARDPEVLCLSRSGVAGTGLVIVARAVARRGSPPARGTAQAVLFLSDAEHQLHASRQRLRSLFELTRAESELIALLAEGCSLRTAAERLAITNESARTYLKRALQKTGTRRQAELVRLVLSVATAGVNGD